MGEAGGAGEGREAGGAGARARARLPLIDTKLSAFMRLHAAQRGVYLLTVPIH